MNLLTLIEAILHLKVINSNDDKTNTIFAVCFEKKPTLTSKLVHPFEKVQFQEILTVH